MLRGYVWVESPEQIALRDTQTQALLMSGVAPEEIYEDLECSRRQERPALQICLNTLHPGDTLIVWQLERLVNGRSHMLKILEALLQRDIRLKVLNGQGAAFDKLQISLEQILIVLAAINELESQVVSELSKIGVAEARAKGKAFGPKPKMTASLLRQIRTTITTSNHQPIAAIARELGINRGTIYKYLNGDGSLKPAGEALLEKGGPEES